MHVYLATVTQDPTNALAALPPLGNGDFATRDVSSGQNRGTNERAQLPLSHSVRLTDFLKPPSRCRQTLLPGGNVRYRSICRVIVLVPAL